MALLPMTAVSAFQPRSNRQYTRSPLQGMGGNIEITMAQDVPMAPVQPGHCQCLDNGEMIVNDCNTAAGYEPWCDMANCNAQGECPCHCQLAPMFGHWQGA